MANVMATNSTGQVNQQAAPTPTTQIPTQVPGQVHYYLGAETTPNILQNYNIKAAQITGWIQFGCGIASILTGIIAIFITYYYIPWYNGIWAGLLFFGPSGLLGFFSRKRHRCLVIAYMVMSIISSVVAGFSIIFSLNGIGYSYYGGSVAVYSFVAVVGFVELITSIVAAAFCCAVHQCCANCCGPTKPQTNTGNVVYFQSNGGPNGFVHPMQYSAPPSYNASQQMNAVGVSSLGANAFVVQPMPQVQSYVVQGTAAAPYPPDQQKTGTPQ